MQYLLLIYDAEKNIAAMPENDYARLLADYRTFRGDLAQSGTLVGGNRLHDVAEAATGRVRAMNAHGVNQIGDVHARSRIRTSSADGRPPGSIAHPPSAPLRAFAHSS